MVVPSIFQQVLDMLLNDVAFAIVYRYILIKSGNREQDVKPVREVLEKIKQSVLKLSLDFWDFLNKKLRIWSRLLIQEAESQTHRCLVL